MLESATSESRRRTAARITRCARVLADERGVDGFTMDEVAACAGVSRRTLFNHVAGKFDAILGVPLDPDPTHLVVFAQGGPTGRFPDDLRATVAAVLARTRLDPEATDRIHRLITSDPRLYKALHDKFAKLAGLLAAASIDREGPSFGTFRAEAVATITLSTFDVALKSFVADPTTSLAEYYVRAFDAVAMVFDGRPRDAVGARTPP